MTRFSWADRYDIGVDNMNHDHQDLLKLMEKLEFLIESHGSKTAISEALIQLADFTVRHFEKEEHYMESINFPSVETHKIIHKTLLEKFNHHQKTFESSGQIGEEFLNFLSLWLSSHICGIDIKYAEHSRGKKVS